MVRASYWRISARRFAARLDPPLDGEDLDVAEPTRSMRTAASWLRSVGSAAVVPGSLSRPSPTGGFAGLDRRALVRRSAPRGPWRPIGGSAGGCRPRTPAIDRTDDVAEQRGLTERAMETPSALPY